MTNPSTSKKFGEKHFTLYVLDLLSPLPMQLNQQPSTHDERVSQ